MPAPSRISSSLSPFTGLLRGHKCLVLLYYSITVLNRKCRFPLLCFMETRTGETFTSRVCDVNSDTGWASRAVSIVSLDKFQFLNWNFHPGQKT
jgi:hypothetical protein